jgi:hypothetical protein
MEPVPGTRWSPSFQGWVTSPPSHRVHPLTDGRGAKKALVQTQAAPPHSPEAMKPMSDPFLPRPQLQSVPRTLSRGPLPPACPPPPDPDTAS